MDMGCGLCGLGEALLLSLFQFVLAPPTTGAVTGLLVGLMLPQLKWWTWLLLGLAVGVGSAALHIGLYVSAVFTGVISGSEVTAWLTSMTFALLPFPIVLFLALRCNNQIESFAPAGAD